MTHLTSRLIKSNMNLVRAVEGGMQFLMNSHLNLYAFLFHGVKVTFIPPIDLHLIFLSFLNLNFAGYIGSKNQVGVKLIRFSSQHSGP